MSREMVSKQLIPMPCQLFNHPTLVEGQAHMTHNQAGNYKSKHPVDIKIDERISPALSRSVKDGEVGCADAWRIATELGVPMSEVGVGMDLMEIRIKRCMLGLFGYPEGKVAVKPAAAASPQLEADIRASLVNGRLPCKTAWDIADRLKISKLEVSSACEAMGIKVKPCQLGAF